MRLTRAGILLLIDKYAGWTMKINNRETNEQDRKDYKAVGQFLSKEIRRYNREN